MNLYTEEQIREALDNEDFAYIADIVIAQMQPIELQINNTVSHDNKVILITKENQQQVIDFWDKIILYYHHNVYYQIDSYCGIINGIFKCYSLEDVKNNNVEIIDIIF